MTTVNQTDTPHVSVIIPVYNDRDNLCRCLDALAGQTYPTGGFEVIVVDNGGHEDLRHVAERHPRIIMTAETTPGSYAARNKGILSARGEIIAFTDSDCIPADNWIEKGVSRLSRLGKSGAVGGRIEFFFRDKNRPTAYELFDSISFFQQSHTIEHKHFSVTANLFVTKTAFSSIGMFNAGHASGGDVEWGNRLYAQGIPLVYDQETLIYHPARNSFNQIYRKTVRVTGGLHVLTEHKSFIKKITALCASDILPPVRRMVRISRDPRIRGFQKKTKVLAIIICLKYVVLFEKIRLIFGGAPQNK